ncbi:(+)-neomenthol dehydrogenase-like [Pyrus x bretschneideri]|uniref:(+)-neomenthol dehydrogenase-like n=1 Tax=Pyrus x bretschneideri TaxID=225117 RepID=UPI00202F66D1|nr:(+)-neomenthol dehydrogenase-like [Pyrus x bretschneideri]
MAEATKRYAVVTGANKGVGFGTVKQLASNGIMLDVTNSASIASLADFVKTQFGKLDILVNNAGINGSIVNPESFRSAVIGKMPDEINWNEISMTPNYELAEECLKTNYYGPKSVTEALLPLLKLSDSPRIINVSSGAAKLMDYFIENRKAQGQTTSREHPCKIRYTKTRIIRTPIDATTPEVSSYLLVQRTPHPYKGVHGILSLFKMPINEDGGLTTQLKPHIFGEIYLATKSIAIFAGRGVHDQEHD